MSEPTTAPDPAALGSAMAQTMPDVTGAPTAAPASAGVPAPAAAPSAPEPTPVSGVTRDGRGVPFDPARHLPKKTAKGNWLPRSPGRFGGKGAAARNLPTPPGSTPKAELFGQSSPPPSSASRSPGTKPATAGGSYIPPETDLPPPAGEKSAPKAAAPGAEASANDADPVASSEDAAEVGCRALYSITGGFTGAPEEAEPSSSEHAHLRKTIAAYLRARGIETRGGWAVLLAVAGWAFRTHAKPKTRAWFAGLMAKRGGSGPIIDITPAPSAPRPAPAPAPAAQPPSPAPAAPMAPPSVFLNLPGR